MIMVLANGRMGRKAPEPGVRLQIGSAPADAVERAALITAKLGIEPTPPNVILVALGKLLGFSDTQIIEFCNKRQMPKGDDK